MSDNGVKPPTMAQDGRNFTYVLGPGGASADA